MAVLRYQLALIDFWCASLGAATLLFGARARWACANRTLRPSPASTGQVVGLACLSGDAGSGGDDRPSFHYEFNSCLRTSHGAFQPILQVKRGFPKKTKPVGVAGAPQGLAAYDSRLLQDRTAQPRHYRDQNSEQTLHARELVAESPGDDCRASQPRQTRTPREQPSRALTSRSRPSEAKARDLG